jgi:hypothetical protein
MKKTYYADKKMLPPWFNYPAEFSVLVDQGLVEFAPWYIADTEFSIQTSDLLKKRYNRDLFPFAHRYGSDTVACLENGGEGKIYIINGHSSAGHENEGSFDSFWNWFRFAIEELIELNG